MEQEIIDKAEERAKKEMGDKILKNIPKTATGLESDFNALRKSPE